MNKLTPLHLHYLKQFCNILAVGMVQTEKTAETAEKKTTAEIETMALRNFLTHLNQGWERGQSLAAFEQWIAQKTTSPKPSPLLFEPQTLVVETTTVEQSAVASVTTTLPNEPPTSPPTPEIVQTNANEFFATLPWAKATPTISTTETTTVATTTTEVSTVSQPIVAEEITQPSISSHQTTADFFATLPWTQPIQAENIQKSQNIQPVKNTTAAKPNDTQSTPIDPNIQPLPVEPPPTTDSTPIQAEQFFTTLPWQRALAQAPTPLHEFTNSKTTASFTPAPSINAGDFFGSLNWRRKPQEQPPATKSPEQPTTTATPESLAKTTQQPQDTPKQQPNEQTSPTPEILKNTAEFFSSLPWQHVLAQPSSAMVQTVATTITTLTEKTKDNQPASTTIEQNWLNQYTQVPEQAADFFASLPWQAGKSETLHITPGKTTANSQSISPTNNPILVATQSALNTANKTN